MEREPPHSIRSLLLMVVIEVMGLLDCGLYEVLEFAQA
jgi:hypothetical protein